MCFCSSSCLTLCDSKGCNLWGSSVHGIISARIWGWVAVSYFRGHWSRDQTWVTGSFFTIESPGIPYYILLVCTFSWLHRHFIDKCELLITLLIIDYIIHTLLNIHIHICMHAVLSVDIGIYIYLSRYTYNYVKSIMFCCRKWSLKGYSKLILGDFQVWSKGFQQEVKWIFPAFLLTLSFKCAALLEHTGFSAVKYFWVFYLFVS